MTFFTDKNGYNLSVKEVINKGTNRIYNYGLDFELMLLRWVGCVPSHLFRKVCYGLAGMKMGKGSVIHIGANFFQPKNITIGEDTIVGDHAFLDGRAKLTIGNHVDIASQVLIYNSEHDLTKEDFSAIEAGKLIHHYRVNISLKETIQFQEIKNADDKIFLFILRIQHSFVYKA